MILAGEPQPFVQPCGLCEVFEIWSSSPSEVEIYQGERIVCYSHVLLHVTCHFVAIQRAMQVTKAGLITHIFQSYPCVVFTGLL